MSDSHSPPLVSIIIVNWNVGRLVVQCIDSLYAHGGLTPEQQELLVLDNASTDDSAAVIRAGRPDVRLDVLPENLGFGRANNLGLQASRAEFVLLLNPDTIVRPGAIKALVDAMQTDSRIGIVGAKLLNRDGSLQRSGGGSFPTYRNVIWNYLFLNRLMPRWSAPPALFIEECPAGLSDIDWVSGAALLVRRSAVRDRLFDVEYFMYGEDIELCHRLGKAGWRICYHPGAEVVHLYGQSIQQQESAVILAAPLKGPRNFFIRLHGRSAIVVYDGVLVLAYSMRWVLLGIMGRITGRDALLAQARMSRKFTWVALKSLFGRS